MTHPIIKASNPTKRVISAEALVNESPRSVKLSAWKNPTGARIVAEVYVDGPRVLHEGQESEDGVNPTRRVQPATWARIEWGAGETVEIPSSFDAAIHLVDKRGIVCGGLAPQLRRVGAPEPTFAAGIA